MVSKNKKSNSKKTQKPVSEQVESKEKTKEPSLKNDKILLVSILVIVVCILALILLPKLTDTNTEIETETYNGFVFEKYGEFWVTLLQVRSATNNEIRPYEVFFHYTPQEVEYIPSMQNSRNDSITPELFMDAKLIYITTDPKYPASVILGGVEISKILGNIYKKEVKSALTKPDNRTNAPVKTCEDIGPDIRIIHLKLGNETKIYSNNGCIVVEGQTPIDIIKASERLSFEILKIM